MNIQQLKKLLRSTKPENFVLKDAIKHKIENVHNQNMGEVMRHLQNPDMMLAAEPQVSRNIHDETYALCFVLSKRKTLLVVITYKTLENKIFIVTAFHSSKRMDKLIKKPSIKRSIK